MKEPTGKSIKAWAKEYEESPFFFEQDSRHGRRLVAWSEQSDQVKSAFYALLKLLPSAVGVLLKVSAGKTDSKPLWFRYHGNVDREDLQKVVRQNESYVFSDGMHQLCFRDPDTGHYFALDDHGILFVYEPTDADADVFRSLGFEKKYAEPLYSAFHYHRQLNDSENLKAKLIRELGLVEIHSKDE